MADSFHIFKFGILVILSSVLYVSPVFGDTNADHLTETVLDDLGNIEQNEHLTRPTFGQSHESHEKIVENGFKFNNQTFSLYDNHHTPFPEQSITIGEVNSFESVVYSQKGLRIQEFLFGIPEVGKAHLAELGIEVWYDPYGEIQKVLTIQLSNVIDRENIIATSEKIKCKNSDIEKKCDKTKIEIMFLEPLRDKVMAIKAIDYKNRYQITYLNEGFDISDESLNPMQTLMIPSTIKGEGSIKVTQSKKYSIYWESEDGRIFERNTFDSFKQINKVFDRFQDSGDPLTRHHSGFYGVIQHETEKAMKVFNATSLISKIPDSYTLETSDHERITEEIKETMKEQDQIAQKLLDDSQVQARYSKHSR
ncbi:MAG: hypothetical protein OEQ12_04865 [Nitrosopumilus sp.]|nr:hypothetical protein [Nitrosopumilus sp.]